MFDIRNRARQKRIIVIGGIVDSVPNNPTLSGIEELGTRDFVVGVAVVDDRQFMSRGYGLLCANRARSHWRTEAMASADRRPSALLRKDHTVIRKLLTSLTLAAAISIPLASSADAGIGDGAALGAPSLLTQLPYVEEAQFIYGGYYYCWYPAGWHGPGWYRCGWAWRTGFGWGGGWGWNGWVWRGGWHRWGWHGGGWHRWGWRH